MAKDKEKNKKETEQNPQDRAQDVPKSAEDDPLDEQPFVGMTMEEFDAMEKQIEALQAELEETREGWLRARADFENYKKRVQRDAVRTQMDAMSSVLLTFLNVSDDLERALKHQPEEEQLNSWVAGIELILQKLYTQMKNQGVERMDVQPGDEFDPNVHEAISQEDSDEYRDGQIIDVIQPGYRIADRVIRPAMVRVAR